MDTDDPMGAVESGNLHFDLHGQKLTGRFVLVRRGQDDSGKSKWLLLHKDEIEKLAAKVSQGGYTLVPLSLYFSDGRAKVELAVAKGKKEYDKRHALRERQDKREAERAMRTRNRLNE